MNSNILAVNFRSIIKLVIAVLALAWFIFFFYPTLVDAYLKATESGYVSKDDILGKGTYGDMYGALNTFFSGLAFIGLLITIFLQIFIHERETNLEKQRIEDEQTKLQENHYRLRTEKMLYIIAILNRIYQSNNLLIRVLNSWMSVNRTIKFSVSPISFSSTIDSINTISNKIDQQEYYSTYREFKDDTLILDVFGLVDDIKTLRTQVDFDTRRLLDFYTDKQKEINASQHRIQQTISNNKILLEFAVNSSLYQINTHEDLVEFCKRLKRNVLDYKNSKTSQNNNENVNTQINHLLGISDEGILISETENIINLATQIEMTLRNHFKIIDESIDRLVNKNNQFVGIVRRIELLFEIRK